MAYSTGWRSGRWKAVCDRCGFRFHSDALKLEWTGLRVCGGCFETRNPQDFLKIPQEKITPDWIRPEAPDNFNYVCSVFAWGGADYAQADCAQADAKYRPQ